MRGRFVSVRPLFHLSKQCFVPSGGPTAPGSVGEFHPAEAAVDLSSTTPGSLTGPWFGSIYAHHAGSVTINPRRRTPSAGTGLQHWSAACLLCCSSIRYGNVHRLAQCVPAVPAISVKLELAADDWPRILLSIPLQLRVLSTLPCQHLWGPMSEIGVRGQVTA